MADTNQQSGPTSAPNSPPAAIPASPYSLFSQRDQMVIWELKRIRRCLELWTGIDTSTVTLND